MKHLTRAALLVGGAMIISQTAFGQGISFVQGNLYLGFQNSAATADYMVNLGSGITNFLGKSSVVDVSGYISLSDFNSVNNTSGTTLAAVIGANRTYADAFGTVLRTSNIGNPKVAGSVKPSTLLNYTQDGDVYVSVSNLQAPAATGTGTLDSTKSWSTDVSPISATGNYFSAAGFNPNSTVTTSSVLYEDLYLTTDTSGGGRGDTGQPYIYQGYFTIDFTGSGPKVTFSSTNAPVTVTLSKPVIVSVAKSGSTVTVVSTNAAPSHSYQLQDSASLSPAAWSNVGSAVTASGTTVTNTDTSATAADRFYRVQGQ